MLRLFVCVITFSIWAHLTAEFQNIWSPWEVTKRINRPKMLKFPYYFLYYFMILPRNFIRNLLKYFPKFPLDIIPKISTGVHLVIVLRISLRIPSKNKFKIPSIIQPVFFCLGKTLYYSRNSTIFLTLNSNLLLHWFFHRFSLDFLQNFWKGYFKKNNKFLQWQGVYYLDSPGKPLN